jgi:SAM-dependent methyltransferase
MLENIFLLKMTNLLPLQSFSYLVSCLSGNHSRSHIDEVLNSVFLDFDSVPLDISLDLKKSKHKRIKTLRKNEQYSGILSLINFLGSYENILEVACGNGDLARKLAESFLGSEVSGFDVKKKLIDKLNQKKMPDNLRFYFFDAFDFEGKDYDLVLGLHACGEISDKVIDIAVRGGSDVLVVPCCYGNLSHKERIAKSKTLRDVDFGNVVRKIKNLEGRVNDRFPSFEKTFLEVHRTMVNLDRAFYLKEKGYDVFLTRITNEKGSYDGKEHVNSSLNQAIVGVINNF